MGTSKDERSPHTPPWRPALAVLGKPDVSPERQLIEIWRSAYGDRGQRLIDDFSSPAIAEACRLVAERVPLNEALNRFDESNARENRGGLAIELGRRALARCAAISARPSDFVQQLFAEATSYYASRDLPSFVAQEGRVRNNSEVIALKQALQTGAKRTVERFGEPPLDQASWSALVKRTVNALTGEER
jgi:hypothetical protein